MNKVVSKCVKKKLGVVVLFFASIGCIMSCNLFNPTNSSNIDSDDADGLLYEGQMLFRNGEYTKAAEYFNKAIKADSTKSQAWFGLAKANMYSSDVTAFDMYNDLQVEDNEIPFMGMSTFDIERYHAGISITMAPLRELVRRDTLTELYQEYRARNGDVTGSTQLQQFEDTYGPDFKGFPLSDRKIIFANFSVSYAFLDFADLLLEFQYSNRNFHLDIQIDPETQQVAINMDSLYSAALNNPDNVDILNASIDSLDNNIDNLINVVIPTVTTLLEGSSLTDSLTGDSSDIGNMIDDIVTENVNSVGQTISFYKVGDGIDNDGDGCVDEEVLDSKDNDGDGFVDEDLRLVLLTRENSTYGEEGYTEIITIHDEGLTSDHLDHDGDGVVENIEERTFIYTNTTERNSVDDYRLVFASTFTENFASDTAKTNRRVAIMADLDSNNIVYPLSFRQTNIGGCWDNYDANRFANWFRNR